MPPSITFQRPVWRTVSFRAATGRAALILANSIAFSDTLTCLAAQEQCSDQDLTNTWWLKWPVWFPHDLLEPSTPARLENNGACHTHSAPPNFHESRILVFSELWQNRSLNKVYNETVYFRKWSEWTPVPNRDATHWMTTLYINGRVSVERPLTYPRTWKLNSSNLSVREAWIDAMHEQ